MPQPMTFSFRCFWAHKRAFKVTLTLTALLTGFIGQAQQATQQYPFQNPNLSFEQRATALVSRLTLKKKVHQMLNSAPAIERLGIPAYDWWNEVLHGVARTPFRV